ncbi:MAG TPA: leucine dehydrogenase, partial [Thermoanaerobaculia bacterium]
MELFQQMAGMGHERVLFCSNPDVGLQAIIAVHSTVLGPGLGGVRM